MIHTTQRTERLEIKHTPTLVKVEAHMCGYFLTGEAGGIIPEQCMPSGLSQWLTLSSSLILMKMTDHLLQS